MTLPTLTAKYQKRQTAVQLQKSYSEISQLLKRSEVDNGSMEYWDYTLAGNIFYKKYLKPYIKNVKEISNSEFSKYMVYTNLNGQKCASEVWCTMGNSYYFYLSSGVVIGVMSHSGQTLYKALSIDINGDKNPNQLGKDVFIFSISKTKKGLVPYGYIDAGIAGRTYNNFDRQKLKTYSDYACNKNSKGIWCTAIIYTDNWEISDDYPW